jgi:hypothetical protein
VVLDGLAGKVRIMNLPPWLIHQSIVLNEAQCSTAIGLGFTDPIHIIEPETENHSTAAKGKEQPVKTTR